MFLKHIKAIDEKTVKEIENIVKDKKNLRIVQLFKKLDMNILINGAPIRHGDSFLFACKRRGKTLDDIGAISTDQEL